MRGCVYGDAELVEMFATFLVFNGRAITPSTLVSLFNDTKTARQRRLEDFNMKQGVKLPEEYVANQKKNTVVYAIANSCWAFVIYGDCILATKVGSGESPEYVLIKEHDGKPKCLDFSSLENNSLIPANVQAELLEYCNPQNPFCKKVDLDNARLSFHRDVNEAKQKAFTLQYDMDYRMAEVRRKQEESYAKVAQLEATVTNLTAATAKSTTFGETTFTMLEDMSGRVNTLSVQTAEVRASIQTYATAINTLEKSHKTMQMHFMIAVAVAILFLLALHLNTQTIKTELTLHKTETNIMDNKLDQAIKAMEMMAQALNNQQTANAQRYLPAPEPRPAPLPPPMPSTSTSSFSFWFMVVVFIIMAFALVVMYGHSSMCMKEMKNQRILMENGEY